MSVPKLDGNTELIIAQHMLRDLEEYLKSDALYWHVAEPNPLGSHMPQLTIGALLEAEVRAGAGGADATALAEACSQHERIRAAHPARYVGKAIHELHSRLDAWKANLEDDSRKTKGDYAQDARVRAKIHLLESALGSDSPNELRQYPKLRSIGKDSPLVRGVRGKGLMIGVELEGERANEFKAYAFQRKQLVNVAGGRTVRLVPPLIISDQSMAALNETMRSFLTRPQP